MKSTRSLWLSVTVSTAHIVFVLLLLVLQAPATQSIPILYPITESKNLASPSSRRRDSIIRQCRQTIENLTTGKVKPVPRLVQHLLYWLTAADSAYCILLNEYPTPDSTRPWLRFAVTGIADKHPPPRTRMLPTVYSNLFYFARLRPRLLCSVGALFRAVQLCTPLRRVLDPGVGVGAGINLCAVLANSRWVKPLILGWTTTKAVWVFLGARPNRNERATIPISLSLAESERAADVEN